MCVSIWFYICLVIAALWSPEVVLSLGCDEEPLQLCPSVVTGHIENHEQLVTGHIENYEQLVSTDLREREGFQTVNREKNQKNFNEEGDNFNDNQNEVDDNLRKFTGSSIDIFPQVETTPPNTNGHFGSLNSSCYFTDTRRVFFICDSLTVVSFPQDEIPSSVPVFKLNGTSVTSIPSHAFQDKEMEVVSIVDNLQLTNIHHKPFLGVKGLRYLYIRRNINWSGVERNKHSNHSNHSFFELFEGADTLIHLVLDFNALAFEEGGRVSANNKTVLPCLQYLSLAFNPIRRLEDDIFQPLRCSQITELNLQSCHLQYIGKDTFAPLNHLQHVDFYKNPFLFQLQPDTCNLPIQAAMMGLKQQNFANLGFSSNGINTIPTDSLATVKDSLIRLNLEKNSFQQLGEGLQSSTFPKMDKLEILILNSCRISQISSSTFENLTALQVLSLRDNPIHQFHTAFLIPTLRTLDLQIEMDNHEGADSPNHFHFPPAMFEKVNMSGLRSLTIEDAHFTNLTGYHFSGLNNLEILSLQRSTFEEIPDLILGNLSNLKNLSLAHCKSEIPIKLTSLMGPRELRVLDLNNAKIIVECDHFGESINTTFQPFPLEYTQVLNLTGSLRELTHPLDFLHFERMKKLTVLEIGKNQIEFWNKTYFNESFNIHTLRMDNNRKVISITEEMIEDFSNLSVLDLTNNDFICNAQIPAFYKMIQKRNGTLSVLGYGEGEGYKCQDQDHYCQDDKGENSPTETVSFKAYATCGRDINEGTDIRDFVPATAIIGAVVGFGICLVVVSYLYVNRLYVSYYLLQLKSRYKPRPRRREPFLYDAFISSSPEDEAWVTHNLLHNLEMIHPKLRAAVHHRDFEVGKTITENMVECIDNSRKIVLVVSESYTRSHWCMFEAHLAQHRLVEENRRSLIVVTKDKIPPKLLTKKMKILLKSPSNLAWSSDDKDSSFFWKKLKVSLMKKSDIYAIDTVSENIHL